MSDAPNNNKTILITGAAGYIGSHTAIVLAETGYDLVLVDSFINSKQSVPPIIERLINQQKFDFIELDIRDEKKLFNLFSERKTQGRSIDAVIHFAGLKSPAESVAQPLRYWRHNLESTAILLDVMKEHDCCRLVFSSSAAVYAPNAECPIAEYAAIGPSNPYGQTKLAIEMLLGDLAKFSAGWNIIALRYFNPTGAHPDGLLGEDPYGPPANLIPIMMDVAAGIKDSLAIFGDDWQTSDGSGVRDYIHVMDLAEGHRAALERIFSEGDSPGFEVFNLGTGKGTSVRELISMFEKVSGAKIPNHVESRRVGDVAQSYADPSNAATSLGWKAERSIDDALLSAWNFLKTIKN